jgi:anthranilate phosphoribosyltransferase
VTEAEAEATFTRVLSGEMSEAQIEALLVELHHRGETASEIAGAARAAQKLMIPFTAANTRAIDTCGTGGDGLGTFNVSTAVALAAAAWGATIVKHGNRAASSKSGSADVLESLGFSLAPDEAASLLAQKRFAFLFAPNHHPGFLRVAPLRRRLGHRTIFNLLGPLVNPANVRRQVMGVYDERWVEPVADVLLRLGRTRAMVVHGGIPVGPTDEIAPWGQTKIAEIEGGEVTVRTSSEENASGGDAAENAAIIRAVLSGAGHPAARELVALNLAAAMWAHGDGGRFEDNFDDARRFVASGETTRFFGL